MKILIVEDEQRAALDLQATIREWAPDTEFLGILDSVESAVEWFQTHPSPDLAFFDIHLADGQSFDIFAEAKVECPVVFCTAYDAYALQAFQVNGIDYILKPFDQRAVGRALEKVQSLDRFFQKRDDGLEKKVSQLLESLRSSSAKNTFLVAQRDKLLPISVHDIAYFYIEHEVCFLQTFDGRRFQAGHPLDELEKMVDARLFFRANRQYLVHFKAIQEVEQYFARKLKLQLRVPVKEPVVISKAKSGAFLEWLESR